jgi:RNA-directed DNA polymerase
MLVIKTFNFLGFTHICGRSRQNGYFTVYRKTIGKRMAAKLKSCIRCRSFW